MFLTIPIKLSASGKRSPLASRWSFMVLNFSNLKITSFLPGLCWVKKTPPFPCAHRRIQAIMMQGSSATRQATKAISRSNIGLMRFLYKVYDFVIAQSYVVMLIHKCKAYFTHAFTHINVVGK